MQYNRKRFLQMSSAAAGAMAFSPFFSKLLPEKQDRKLKDIGLQLYTVRDVFEKDPKGVLKQLAEFGYTQLESYERKEGMFWGMTNKTFQQYIGDLGMQIISSHCDIDNDFERKAAEAAAIDMKYLIAAWEGPGKSIDDYKRMAEDFNRKGSICKQNGIGFAFHNHHFSFQKIGTEFPQDVLLNNTDPSLVDFEMDIYWVVATGQDPETWLKKYPKRFRLCHVKDRSKGTTKMEDTCDLGTGSIAYASLVRTARKNGMKYFFAEQEHYPGSTPMMSAKADAEYMKALRF